MLDEEAIPSHKHTLLKVDVQETINSNPLTKKLYSARLDILANKDTIVPKQFYDFFAEYARRLDKKVRILEENIVYTVGPVRHSCIMYSGGSESQFMANMLYRVDLVYGYNFFPHGGKTKGWREFQVALLGMAMGYSNVFLGVPFSEFTGEALIEYYEFSSRFVKNWNRNFSTKIQSLISVNKAVIYEQLYTDNVYFSPCETSVPPCGKCIHCFEHHMINCLLEENIADINIRTRVAMDKDVMQKYQNEYAEAYKENKIKYLGMSSFLQLENIYDFKLWRGEEGEEEKNNFSSLVEKFNNDVPHNEINRESVINFLEKIDAEFDFD